MEDRRRFDPAQDQPLAVCLAFLAGLTDAIGFLWLGGFFISFMTGNTTRLGTELGGPDWRQAGTPLAVLALFVSGVVAATMLRRTARHGRRLTMTLITALLFASSVLEATGHTTWAMVAATLGMGVENTVFEYDGEVSVGLTYMTGTLVKMGQHLATALIGGPVLGWLPYLCRWLGMLGGAVAGSLAYHRVGLNALWLSTAIAVVLTVFTFLQAGRR